MSRGKPVIRARGRGGPAKRGRDAEAEGDDQTPQPTAAPSQGPITSPPSYHYDVRKAIRAVLDDKEFTTICSTEGNIVLTTELLLDPVCAACDAATHEPPQSTPVTSERIVYHVLDAIAAACQSTVVLSGFASLFARRAVNFLPKLEPIHHQHNEHHHEAAEPPQRVARAGGSGGAGAPSETGALLPLPPPQQSYAMSTNYGGLLPTPDRSFPSQSWQGLPQPLFSAPPPTQPVFAAPPPAQVACTGRVIALDNVPQHFLGGDALRPQIQMLSSRLRGCYFFNTRHLENTQTVIVSVNTPQAATELVARVNYTSHVDGGPIMAREATQDEAAALWSPLLDQLQAQEAATLEKLQQYDQRCPERLRASWHAAQETLVAVDQELEMSSLNGSLVPARKLELLRAKLGAKQEQDTAASLLAGLNEPLEGPEVEACSSSTAAACGGGSLLYIVDVPPNIPDRKFLVLFEPLRALAQLVHVWRDPTCPTQLCCALYNAGQVFAVLRALDCNDFRFCGATFSKQKPQQHVAVPYTPTGGLQEGVSLEENDAAAESQ